jgi:hypothetical protein
MLPAGRTLQIKQDTSNRAALRIANHSLNRSRAGRRTFWDTAAGLSLTREQEWRERKQQKNPEAWQT